MTGVARGGTGDTSYIASVHSDGNHRVPNVNRNSDGDFKFNLGNFENDWDSDNCLLCFCNSLIFLPLFIGGSFFLKAFLPASKHSSYLVQLKDELSVGCMVEHFMLPPDLEEEFKNVRFPNSLGDERQFLKFVVGEGCPEYDIEHGEVYVVDPRADGIAVNAIRPY